MTRPPEPVARRFVSQRLDLSYVDWGNDGAPALLLVHGGRDHARSWDWVARELCADWHVVCPDLRGHGDSAWSPDADYTMPAFVADLAEFVHHLGERRVTIVAHSLGGAISLQYAGIYPEKVARIVAIEGVGMTPRQWLAYDAKPVAERFRLWIEQRRALADRHPRRYPSIEVALERMREQNAFLGEAQARHLTEHGLRRHADGTFGWKFDNHLRSLPPVVLREAELHELWANIACPVWLVHGADSWASHPGKDGRAAHFRDATVTSYERSGHWVQHDRFADFVADLKGFLQFE